MNWQCCSVTLSYRLAAQKEKKNLEPEEDWDDVQLGGSKLELKLNRKQSGASSPLVPFSVCSLFFFLSVTLSFFEF